MVWELTTEVERLFHRGIVWGKRSSSARASLYVWYLQYWAAVWSNCEQGSGTCLYRHSARSPQCILWKRSREDPSLWASRDGHSSSSSISLTPTLLVFRHLLPVQCPVQQAAVLSTFSTRLTPSLPYPEQRSGLILGVGIASENRIVIYHDFWVCIEIRITIYRKPK